MIEKVGNQDVFVRDYTSNFNIKEYIQNVLMPKAFPNIPIAKLNLGFTGIMSEMISQAIEDGQATASLMMNEAFITRAILPQSIYSAASLFNLGYSFANPSKCTFGLQIWLPDIIKYSQPVTGSATKRYRLDKDTRIVLGDNAYRFDYDIIIDHQMIGGNRIFNVYYDMDGNTNSISKLKSKYIKHQVTSIDWLVLIVDLQEFERKVDTINITDNLVTVNSDVEIKWNRQIAGIDLLYITPQGEELPMELRTQYTKAIIDPFVWYKFKNSNTMILSFSNNKGYFTPQFNSKIRYTTYTCRGSVANFDSYDRRTGIPVQKSGGKYSYNATTRMVALCYGPSVGGADKGTIEDLRDDIIFAYNTAEVLTTDRDLQLWFDKNAKRYGTKVKFFKRRDDPTGRLFSQFVAIVKDTYIYPTNTLGITVKQDQFDYINKDSNDINSEFIITPGHLWEYDDQDGVICRDRLRMVEGTDGLAKITDAALPGITSERPFMFVNPFYIKIYRDPMISANYNCLINHTSWPTEIPFNSNCFYQFQLATLSIERSLSRSLNNKYHIQVICVPTVTTDKNMKYIEGIGDEYPYYENNLRLVLITRTAEDGETGYIEMQPVELRSGGSILFQAELSVFDNVSNDMKLKIDMLNTPGMKSLMINEDGEEIVLIDAKETSFHFAVMMKDNTNPSTTLYGNDDFKGYVMANRFCNEHRDLTLYKPMSMMRSVISFEGDNDNYTINASLIPFLRWDIPLDEEKMAYFIQAFDDQYASMEPALTKLDGNCSIDFKLYNTYGRSNNYYIGPKENEDSIWTSDILLDNVYVNVKFKMCVYDRSLYTQTEAAVVNDIKKFFDNINSGTSSNVHVSDLIHEIMHNEPNVHYIRFIGFNEYDANKQHIFVKFEDISELREDQLSPYVPEIIRVDDSSIEITEEV